jgi:WD40 repeat protein
MITKGYFYGVQKLIWHIKAVINAPWLMFKCLLLTCMVVGCSEPDITIEAKSSHRFTEGTVVAAALSKDTEMVAILTDDNQASVWLTGNTKLLQTWNSSHMGDEVLHIALSGDKKRLCVAGYWSVTMLDVVEGRVITSWDVQGFADSATVSALHIDQTGENVLVGMSDGAVLSVDMNSQKALKLDHHENKITRLLYANDNRYALSGSTDKNFAYWRTDTGEIGYQHIFRSRVTALALDTQSNQLFVSDALYSHWILDSRTGNKLAKLIFFERFRYFRRGYFTQNGNVLVTSSPKSNVTLWNARTGEELIAWQIKRFTANATVLAMAQNTADELVTLSSDGVIQVWDYRQFL